MQVEVFDNQDKSIIVVEVAPKYIYHVGESPEISNEACTVKFITETNIIVLLEFIHKKVRFTSSDAYQTIYPRCSVSQFIELLTKEADEIETRAKRIIVIKGSILPSMTYFR